MFKALTGLDFNFSILPWKRCLRDVENYSRPGDPEIALDASFNKERAEKYLYVGPMYSISTAVFYSRNRFPDGPLSEETGKEITWINEVIRTGGGYRGAFNMLSRERYDLIERHPLNVIGDITTKNERCHQTLPATK